MGRWSSSDPADVAWRRQQMSANNDIESVGRDPEAEALVAELDAAGASSEQRLDALRTYFTQKAG